KKLLLLSTTDLRTLRNNVEDAGEVIQALVSRPGLNTLLAALNHKLGTAMVSYLAEGLFSPGKPANSTEKALLSLAFLHTLLAQIDQAVSGGVTPYRSPWAEFFGGNELGNDGFLVSDDQRFVYLLVAPQEDGNAFNDGQDSITALRAHIARLKRSFPQV